MRFAAALATETNVLSSLPLSDRKRAIYVDSDARPSRDGRQFECVKVNRPIRPLDENTRPGLIF